MITSRDWLAIPVRSFIGAKSRLATTLDIAERAALARLMLCDVLQAALSVRGLSRIALVSSAGDIRTFAQDAGVAVIDDHHADGVNEAVRRALAHLTAQGATRVVVIPGDIPTIAPGDIADLFAAAAAHGIALGPALADGGTNALALALPAAIDPQFGIDSFVRHIDAARRADLHPHIIRNARIGLDIDDAARLHELMLNDRSTGAARYLRARLAATPACGVHEIRRHTAL